MRMMMKMTIDTEAGSRAIESGELREMMQEMMGRLQPEAAYFGPSGGNRTAFIVFDLKDPSQLPPLTEPMFRMAKAKIEMFPVMNRDDLEKGLQQIGGGNSPQS
jgi:hypothetical protein